MPIGYAGAPSISSGTSAQMVDELAALKADNLEAVARLASSDRYQTIMGKVREALQQGEEPETSTVAWTGPSEEDPTYRYPCCLSCQLLPSPISVVGQRGCEGVWFLSSSPAKCYAALCRLLVDCNQLAVDIDNELSVIHNFIQDHYRTKFPELESLVHHPIDYARVVKAIGNEVDLTMVDLDGVLPSATIMVVSVTASTTSGTPLPEEALQKVRHPSGGLR